MNHLTTSQLKLMFGLIGSGYSVQEITPTNHITLTMNNEKTSTKIVLIPKTISNEKEATTGDNAG